MVEKTPEKTGFLIGYLKGEMTDFEMEEKNIQIAYGHTHQSIAVPQDNLQGVYYPRDVIEEVNEHHILQGAMDHPIGSPPLRELVRRGERIAIITSDISRPCPSERMLPYVISELEAAGIPDEDVLIVIALGLHRQMTQDEIASAITPEMAQRFRVMNHDPDDVLHIGVTDAGTSVDLFRPVVEADRRICLGNLEFHYFAGYS
ncbi:MAG: lactate racemase domain-containing protein, partial [Chloroflexota bacterium]|nr:lactate racemase domain-containing protein [Chloroflexota bacterium]